MTQLPNKQLNKTLRETPTDVHTLPETNSSPKKKINGCFRWFISFWGKSPIFRGYVTLLSFLEGKAYIMLKMPKFIKVRTASVARNLAGVATPPARPLSLELCFFWPQGTAGFAEFFLDPFFFRRNKKQKTHASLGDMRLGEMDVML